MLRPPLARSLFGFAAQPARGKGRLRKAGNLTIYEESKLMSYTPVQLYSVIADVDAYKHFLPFATSSTVLAAKLRAAATNPPIADKGWLQDGPEQRDEVWDLEAELHIGAMGYQEGYVSRIEMKKWHEVTATAKDSTLFKHLVTRWRLTPVPAAEGTAPRTKVDLSLAYAFSSPLHAAAVNTVWEKVSGLMISGFEKRVETVYGK